MKANARKLVNGYLLRCVRKILDFRFLYPHHRQMTDLSKAMILAKQHYDEGRLVEAARTYREIVNNDPANKDALLCWARIAFQRGNYQNVLKILNQLLVLDGVNLEGLVLKACTHKEMEQWDMARNMFDKVLSIDPNNIEALEGRAFIYLEIEDDVWNALALADRAENIDGKRFLVRQIISKASHLSGDSDRAIRICQEDAQADEEHRSEHLRNLAALYMDRGDKNKAKDILADIMALTPDDPETNFMFSKLHKYNEGDDHIQKLKDLCADCNSDGGLIYLNYALFKAHDDMDAYDKAFSYLERANAILRKLYEFDITQLSVRVNGIKDAYTNLSLGSEILPLSNQDIVPIFIVGMPRSGSTVTEQIFAAHSDIAGAGETLYLSGAFDKTDLANVDAEGLMAIRGAYLEKLRRHANGKRYVVDKSLGNCQYIGFVKLLFPDSPVINCSRDPMDTCFSIYKMYFKDILPYAQKQQELGIGYLVYKSFLDFWRSEVPDSYVNLIYEEMVKNPQAVMREVFSACGLDWQDSCLEFYKSERSINTASTLQVREPINDRSIGRWKNYETHLQVLKKTLNLNEV